MTTLNITASQFAELVRPVLPLACGDDMLPVLNAVLIETDGKWLSATTTDRFRLGIKRVQKYATDDDPSVEWPEFRALVPLRAVRSMLTTFKPRRGSAFASLLLTVEDDRLIVEGAGTFDLFDSSRIVHHLQVGEFPKTRSLIHAALEAPTADRAPEFAVNPAFLADFKACGSRGLRVLTGASRADGKPGAIVVTDDNGFIGMLMPTSVMGAADREDWADFLSPKPEPIKKPAAKKAPPRKRAAAKKGAAA
ncbi:hypothetical protein F9L07_19525 [Pimelobacter simplex]|uniref:DNA polymerase III beta sliding clamp central domain-containing protein n=1 Tax=Nocardioides simplex TaxID=2045 RepID=A0A7J5DV87_NOCSI|nr:hypothetical protein [Pimelobacter simplex]KAB2809233.1 hypothetical protein F9L07_19525 [Pimelobacter simplex]